MATTYYVSKSADNGYALGVDTNNGTAKATPFLTVKKGLDTTANGDTVIVNGGTAGNTYSFASVYSGATWWTLIPDPSGGAVTLQDATGGDTRIMTLGVASGQYTIGALVGPQIIFDAQGANTWCLATLNSGVVTSLNLLNCQFINWVGQACELDQITTCVVDTCVFAASASVSASFAALDLHGRAQAATLTYTVRNCTFNLGTLTVNGLCIQYQGTDGATVNVNNNAFTMNVGGSRSVTCISNPAGSTMTLSGNTFNGTLTGTGNTWRGLRHTGGVMNLTATANTFNLTYANNNTAYGFDTITNGRVDVGGTNPTLGNTWIGTASNTLTTLDACGYFAQIGLPTSGTCTHVNVQYNTVTMPSGEVSLGGPIVITIGSNVSGSNPAASNSITGVTVKNNTITGGNHGILVGHLAGVSVVSGNYITNTHYGIVFKDTTGDGTGTNYNLATGNLILISYANPADSNGGALLGRGAQYDRFVNNTCIMTDASTGGEEPAFNVYQDAGAQGACTLVQFVNNNVYVGAGILCNVIVLAQDTSTAIYANNNYYGSFVETAWQYLGTNRNFTQWKAAKEPTALALNPVFANYGAGDYRIGEGSGLYQAGQPVPSAAVDFLGNPFNTARPSIGAYEPFAAPGFLPQPELPQSYRFSGLLGGTNEVDWSLAGTVSRLAPFTQTGVLYTVSGGPQTAGDVLVQQNGVVMSIPIGVPVLIPDWAKQILTNTGYTVQ